MRRLPVLVVALALATATCGGSARIGTGAGGRADVDAYRGLGTWVDVYDYVPAFQKPGQVPAVTPADIDDMKHLGVKTLYLQAAQDDERSPGATISPKLLGRFL